MTRCSTGSPRACRTWQGDFADPDTYEAVERAMNGAASPTFYLEVPRLCSPWWSKVFTAGV